MSSRADNFNRADSTTTLGTPSGGGSAWVTVGGFDWGIASNTAYDVNGGAAWNIAYLEASSANVTLEVTYTTIGEQQCVALRVVDDSNFFFVHASAANGYRLFRREAGGNTVIGTYSTTPANGDVMKVTVSGDSWDVIINTVSRITATDAFQNTATKHGLAGFLTSATGARWDDFTITDLSGGSAVSILVNGGLVGGGLMRGRLVG